MKPHKHAELIKAWADGASIEVRYYTTHWIGWQLKNDHIWYETDDVEYRIKPEPKPDFVMFANGLCYDIAEDCIRISYPWSMTIKFDSNLKLTFDGETGELKSAEVLK